MIAADKADEDTLTNIALETGADDVKSLGRRVRADLRPGGVRRRARALDAAKIKPESAEVTMVATTTVMLQGAEAEKMMKLIDALEDHDDTQAVHSNFEISDAEAARLSGA